ncbi:uncharacterized protein TRIADDRAFT_3775, partial [Trichoplax adhaerens]
ATLLLSISAFGGLGNMLVIFVICKTKKLQNVTHYLIVNLAIADMVVAYSSLDKAVWKIWTNLNGGEMNTFAKVFCKTSAYCMFLSFIASTSFLIALSIERYYSILKPFENRLDRRKLKILIFGVWFLSFIFGIPQIFTTTAPSKFHYQCFVPQISGAFNLCYFISLTLVLYVIPLVTMTNIYIRIGIYVLNNKIPGDPTKDTELLHQKRNHRVATTCFVITALYMMSALPMAINFIIIAFSGNADDDSTFAEKGGLILYSNLSQAIYVLSCAYNPVVYNCLSSDFRKAF